MSEDKPGRRALDRDGDSFPGLAAGSVFPIHGNGSEHIVGGCNSSSGCMGRIAARSVAEEAV